jgi:hypothetical protein
VLAAIHLAFFVHGREFSGNKTPPAASSLVSRRCAPADVVAVATI